MYNIYIMIMINTNILYVYVYCIIHVYIYLTNSLPISTYLGMNMLAWDLQDLYGIGFRPKLVGSDDRQREILR